MTTDPQPAAAPVLAFPDPSTPAGQAWAAAGFPLEDGKPVIPAPATTPAEPPLAGTIALYSSFDAYATPARNRVQVVLVTAHEDDGDGGVRIRGLILGYADDAASFTPAQLTPLT